MLSHAIGFCFPIRDHPAQISLAFTLQPLVPLISGIGDDPAVPLLKDPAKVRPVVVSIDRIVARENVQQLRGFVLHEDIDRIVRVQVRRKGEVRRVKAVDQCQQDGLHRRALR